MDTTYQQTFLVLPLAALGCPLYPPFKTPTGEPVKVRVKLLDTVRFIIARFTHEPEVVIGLPVVAGVPLEEIEKLAKVRLFEEYQRRKLVWPEEPERYPGEAAEYPNGNN
jgi:hypothetical protein